MGLKAQGKPIVVSSEARGCDVTIGYRGDWDIEKAKSAKQQVERDASRKPLTDKEQAVYTRMTSKWQSDGDTGLEEILDGLVDKGWLCKTGYEGHWFYQRVHSLDEEE